MHCCLEKSCILYLYHKRAAVAEAECCMGAPKKRKGNKWKSKEIKKWEGVGVMGHGENTGTNMETRRWWEKRKGWVKTDA